jgi:hypothetical protein
MQDKTKNDREPIMATISTTSCRQCVFAEYEDSIQIGCHAGRLEVFEENGVEILPVTDEEKSFYLVKDKACAYFRHVDLHANILKTKTMEELKDLVRSSLKIPYHVLIFLREKDTLLDLRHRLNELDEQSVKPAIISVIDRTHAVTDMTPVIVGLFQNNYSFKNWRTQRVSAVDISDMAIVDVCYDNTKDMKYFFYTIFEASKPIPASFAEEIHRSIQDKMQSFVILEPNSEGNGKTVLKVAHEKYAGNSFGIDLKKKLLHYDDGVHLIRKVVDLCPSLRTS